MKKGRRIKTVLYGDQRFSDEELDLLHTPALQRLYDLHQLGFTDRVFVDASHSRLHHVIGVIEQVDIIIESLSNNLREEGDRELTFWNTDENRLVPETAAEWAGRVEQSNQVARIMGLLHDLTHAPFGHTLEDEIGLVEEKHDEPRRQAEAFLRLSLQYLYLLLKNHGLKSEVIFDAQDVELQRYLGRPDLNDIKLTNDQAITLGERWGTILARMSDQEYSYPFQTLSKSRIAEFVVVLRKAMIALLHLDIAHKEILKTSEKILPNRPYPFESLLNGFLRVNQRTLTIDEEFVPQRDCYLLDVIGNTICADLLDYAKRDSASAGLKLDYDAGRIVDNFTLVVEESPIDLEIAGKDDVYYSHPFRGHRIRTAIKLFSQKLRTDVPGELLNLLQVRYYVYERMLFHPTKCVVGAMLGAALQLTGIRKLPNHHRYIGDQVFLHQIQEAVEIAFDAISEDPTSLGLGLDETARNSILQRFDQWPQSGSILTAKAIIESISVDSKTIKKKLRIIRKFPGQAKACNKLGEILTQNASSTGLYDRPTLFALVREASAGDRDMIGVLDRLCPTKDDLINNLLAAKGLLERVVARRYYKRLFRLLPNVQLDSVQGELPVHSIASTFLDPHTRYEAERRIEKECGFPLGSIVLHCPPATGPTKIAKIYVTDGATWKKAYLRVIGKIDGNIFLEHQKAVNALEEMYRSTWRLIVSVAPPYTRQWNEAAGKIGNVLRSIMLGGEVDGNHSFHNDEYMERELKAAEQKLGLSKPILLLQPLKPSLAFKTAKITKKRMEEFAADYADKLRTREERTAFQHGLEEIRSLINNNSAYADRFAILEREGLFGVGEEEPLWNLNLKSNNVLQSIREHLGIDPSE